MRPSALQGFRHNAKTCTSGARRCSHAHVHTLLIARNLQARVQRGTIVCTCTHMHASMYASASYCLVKTCTCVARRCSHTHTHASNGVQPAGTRAACMRASMFLLLFLTSLRQCMSKDPVRTGISRGRRCYVVWQVHRGSNSTTAALSPLHYVGVRDSLHVICTSLTPLESKLRRSAFR